MERTLIERIQEFWWQIKAEIKGDIYSEGNDDDLLRGRIKPRPRPVGIRKVMVNPEGDQVSFEVKTAVRFWWAAMPPLVFLASLPVVFVVAPFLGHAMSARDRYGRIETNMIPTVMIVALIIALLALVWSVRSTRPWVRIVATEEEVSLPRPFNKGIMRFDRQYFYGMRIGYSIQTEAGVLNNRFTDGNFGLSGLRLAYGTWGEDLPYLVNGYHASEIVVWMNLVMGGVNDAAPKAHAPEVGIVEEVF